MINKKFLMSFALVGVLLLTPSESRASDSESDLFYAKVAYAPSILLPNAFPNDKIGISETDGTFSSFPKKNEFAYLSGNVGVGYYFGGMRVELEGAMTNTVYKCGDGEAPIFAPYVTAAEMAKKKASFALYSSTSFLSGVLSANYDIALSDFITPYVGAGFGGTRNTINLGGTSNLSAWNMVVQGRVGASITAVSSVVPYVGYKFSYMPSVEYSGANLPNTSTESGVATDIPVKFERDHFLHSVEAGIMVPMNA